MRKLKHLLLVGTLAFIGNACTQSSNDEPSGLYDWDITENIILRENGRITSQNKYIEYNRSEAYVIALKQNFDKKSTSTYRYQMIYKQR